MIAKPKIGSFPAYYERYLNLVPEDDIIIALEDNLQETIELFESISDEKSLFRYASGKWSIRELIGHIIDVERIFAYRALCFSRKEAASIPGFEEDEYVKNSNFNERDMDSFIDEFEIVRLGSIFLFNNMSADMFENIGTANKVTMPTSVMPYMILGHERHHINVLKEKYLK